MLYVPGYSFDSEPVKLGILFDSDTLDIPGDISELVTNILGGVLSSTSSLDIINPATFEKVGYNLGFNKSQFSSIENATIIAQELNAQYMLLTSMNYDLKAGVKAHAVKGMAKLFKWGKPSTKDIKPTFDVKLVDVASGGIILDTKEEIDAFKDDMKQQIVTGAIMKSGLIDLDTSAIAEFATFLAPEIQKVINEGVDVLEGVKIAALPEPETILTTTSTSEDYTSASIDVDIATSEPLIKVTATKPSTTLSSTIMNKVFSSEAEAANKAEKSILVNQPAYHNMSFHVYKVADVPSEYYVTYDGYLVYKADKGIWYYASKDSRGITKTSYVVGSVIPSVVKLNPYDKARASVAPIKGSAIEERSNRGKISIPMNSKTTVTREVTRVETPTRQEISIAMTPSAYNPVILYGANAPEWTSDSNFMAISKWQKSIDRIGILDRPRTPVAWKGDYPEVVYAWTGQQWRQLSAHGRDLTALSIIRREIYGLTVHIGKLNKLFWYDEDTSALSQYSKTWGYKWLGIIKAGKEY